MKAPCGIPDVLWMVNTGMADNLMMQTPPRRRPRRILRALRSPDTAKYLPGDDCFYQYEVQDVTFRNTQ